jgi:hypothetical protein
MKLVNFPLAPKKWIATETPKKYVIWHGSFGRTIHTPYGKVDGRAIDTIHSWNSSDEKYGAPYLVDRSGLVYKTFNDKEWIYHLGIPTTKGFYDKQSIPITIANELYLDKSNGRYFSFGINNSTNQYFGPVFEKSWRGYKHWAKLDEAQIDAAIELTLDVCNRHNIEPVFNPTDEWNPKVWETATIFTHAATKKEVYDFTLESWVIDKIKAAGIKLAHS